ncbi:hypothetical protein ACSHWB_16310 [Lentzea sp. HUAS TT2]|uniref:hypothetical protein n=1 Tax=Lentzea sp. HUAS TT2 TaxID=3447454 RepID=UPI003F72E46A
MSTDYEQRAYHALVRGAAQFADPVNCRETHPHDDAVECTLRRAHMEIERTPHRDENGVEWFAAYCRCAFNINSVEPCTDCGGTRRLLLDRLPDDDPEDHVPNATSS